SDVAGAAPPFAAHFADLEADRKHVRLLGKDVARKAVRKHHDGVVRERAADQCAHGRSGGPAGRKDDRRGGVYRAPALRSATFLLEAAWSQQRSEQPRAPQLPNKGPQRVPRQYTKVRRETSEDTVALPRQTLTRAKRTLRVSAFAPKRSGR